MDLSTTRQSVVPSENVKLLKELASPLSQAQRWIKLFGWMMIGNGVLSVFTLWGILFAWLPIWLGVLLLKAGNSLQTAGRTGDRAQFLMAQEKLKTFFTVNGILLLVTIIAGVVMMLIFGGVIMQMMPMLMQQGATMQDPSMFPTGP